MRLNFTGRRKIEKQHARAFFRDDPPASGRGHYFELALDLAPYKLPGEARVFVEAFRGLTLMRFDLGTVAAPAQLTPEQRRLSDFAPGPDGVKLRVKVTQPDGPEAGKLLAEADGIHPEEGGVLPLIRLATTVEGQAPFRLELVPTDADLPTLYVHKDIGGKEYARDPVGKPLLLTAAVREVFAALASEDLDIDEDDDDHWATLWSRFAAQVLKVPLESEDGGWGEESARQWVDRATEAFAGRLSLVSGMKAFLEGLELQDLEEVN